MNMNKKSIIIFTIVAVLFVPVAYFGHTAVTYVISHFNSTDGRITSEETRIPDIQQISLAMKKVEKLTTNEVAISFPMRHKITIEKNLFGADSLWPDWNETVELQLNGKVCLGLSLSVFKSSDIAVDKSSHKIAVRLPPIEILDTSIDSNNVRIINQTGNHYIGDYHRELVSRALKKARSVMLQVFECQRDKATREAQASAETSLCKLIAPLASGYKVEFNWQEGTEK